MQKYLTGAWAYLRNPQALVDLPYYMCKVFCLFPVQRVKNSPGEGEDQGVNFKVSFFGGICTLVALSACIAYTVDNSASVRLCRVYKSCGTAYLDYIDYFYCATLLWISLFGGAPRLASALDRLSTSVRRAERAARGEREGKSWRSAGAWTLVGAALVSWALFASGPGRALPLAFDTALSTWWLLAEQSLASLSVPGRHPELGLGGKGEEGGLYLELDLVVLLSTGGVPPGRFLVGVLLFKQAQILGLVYFSLLAPPDLLLFPPDTGRSLFLSLFREVTPPLLSFLGLCLAASSLAARPRKIRDGLRSLLITEADDPERIREIHLYLSLVENIHLELSACDFTYISAPFFVDFLASAFQLIVTIQQFKPAKKASFNFTFDK